MDRSAGPYQLGDSLGALPFGELVAATHAARSESLAVLLLDDRLAQNHRFRGLLRLEVARAGGVRHPAIARAIEVGEHADAPYVVVERGAEARTLARALADGDRPSRQETVALIRTLAEGIDAAHGRRIVHGALDPTSILLTPVGGAVLVGAALIGAVEEAGLIEVVAERTDADFTAPEQRAGRRTVASADGYALGVLAAALLQVPPPPADPADAVGVVLDRQRATDPALRFPTCTAFATALAEAMRPTASAAPGPIAVGSAPTTPAPPADRPTGPPTATSVEPYPAGSGHVPGLPAPVPATSPEAPAPPTPVPGRPPGQHPPGPPDAETAEILLTPAMADVLRPPPQCDLVGDAIRLAADRVPAIDDLVDRYAPDGKIGPVPLGLAVPGALALLAILAGSVWLAAMLVVLAGLLYGTPRLGAALTASERASPRVVRVTGIARLRRTSDLFGAGSPELVLGDGTSLSLYGAEYGTLGLVGQPIVVQRPAQETAGVVDVVVGYDLPGTTVTYLAPNLALLDVRAPDGTVLYRRPPYRGEPGDRLGMPSDDPSGRPDFHGDRARPGQLGDATRGEHAVLPMPLAAQAAIRTAATSEAVKASGILGGGLIALVMIPRIVGDFGFLLFVAFLALGLRGSPKISRGISLWNARHLATMIRVVGRIVVTEHQVGNSPRYYVHLADGVRFKVDEDAYRALAYAGQDRITEARYLGSDGGHSTSEERLVSQHEIVAATATYTPGAVLLLEVLDASGDTIYRDPVLEAGDLGSAGPPA